MEGCLDDNAMAAYVDGALTADEITRVDSHLSTCATCRKDLSAMAVAHTMPIAREGGDELVPGDTIGRYVLSSEHARGGMGIVAIAFDPELGRNVAIKVLRPDLSGQLLRDEARAMARLSHPNVVSVHDVGEHDGRIYFAMELVEGVNLRRWLAHERHGWREILRTCIQAGRGLAAAHRVGLVHRDFKPDNVLCGPDDRVRVTDFGLANVPRAMGSGLAGTPAYIAPEVWRGESATARSDQWSFCATLYEALFGTPPFDGTTREEVRASIERGAVEFPTGRRVPAKIRRVIARGLAIDPTSRYASLDELLDELATVTKRPRSVWLALGVGLIALASFGIYTTQRGPQLCQMPSSLVAEAWNDARAKMIETAFAASGRRHAADSARRVREILDRYSREWLAARQQACEATRVRGDQSEALLDKRMRCLDRRRAELAEVARLMTENPKPRVVDRAVKAAYELNGVDTCSAEGVHREVPMPSDGNRAAQIIALEHEIAALSASLSLVTKPGPAMKHALSIIDRARPLDHPPLSARASVLLARLGTYTTDHADTERRLYEALTQTAAAHDDRLSAEIWTYLIEFTAQTKGDPAAALRLIQPAEAALARLESPQKFRAILRHGQGIALTMTGQFEEAGRAFEQARADSTHPVDLAANDAAQCHVEQQLGHMKVARELCARAATTYERELGPHHPDFGFALGAVGLVAFQEHDNRAARTALERSLSIIETSVGEKHIAYAMALNNLAMVDGRDDNFAAARRGYERAAALFESLHHPQLFSAIANLGEMERRIGMYDDARKHLERALEIATETQGKDSSRAADALLALAALAFDAKDYAEAQALYERTLAIRLEQLGEHNPVTAEALYGVGLTLSSRDDCKHAIPYQQRALAAFESAYHANHPAIADALTALARCRNAIGDRHAVDDIERALAIRDRAPGDDAFEAAGTKWIAAKVIWKFGTDRARAVVLAKEARALYAKAPDPQAKGMLVEIDEWLAGHRFQQ
jgi:eukaryotic-like serine/threonine-protein kinase